MKTDQTLSTIFRQLRPSLRQPHSAYSPPRFLSRLAPLRHPNFARQPHTPKCGISKPSLPFSFLQTRQISDYTSTSSAVAHSPEYPSNDQPPPKIRPSYDLTFTCKPCKHRSTHNISKLGYHHGSILITCPECSNRHVISDHLKVGPQSICMMDTIFKHVEAMNTDKLQQQIFGDKSLTIEDLMRQKGQLVKRGTLGGNGDMEFWEDGSQTERNNLKRS